ncbi:MAG TPA: hypothetical protein VL147_21035 [Devosia sp.]|nr:hypothetical protein [Devosia sp.]
MPSIAKLGWCFASLGLVPAGAHVFSLFSKMRLSGADYIVSQRAYDGWNLFAVVVIGALLSTLALAIQSFRAGALFYLPHWHSFVLPRPNYFLDVHLSSQSAHGKLDPAAPGMGVDPAAMGIFPCSVAIDKTGSWRPSAQASGGQDSSRPRSLRGRKW